MSRDERWDQVDQVADIFHNAIHQAIALQSAARRTNEQSANAAALLRELGQKLPADLAAAVNARLEAAAKSAAEQMVQKWSAADAAAASAAAVYRNAESRFTWKLVACLISSVVAIGIVFSTWIFCLTPTEATLHARREEHRLLVSEIERLRGVGLVDIAQCDHYGHLKPCVRVAPSSPDFKGGYKLLPAK